MFQFISKRLVFMLPILVVASLLIFFMMRIANPDPIAAVVGTRRLSDKSRAALAREFHLDKPLFKQYEIWINGMLRGEFPRSFKYREPV
ncbi:MAG: hypothetical protein LBS53_11305, partial [Synergistaceae bacterium]|nr:hypothetical protein [Synergistaceae bacterium]